MGHRKGRKRQTRIDIKTVVQGLRHLWWGEGAVTLYMKDINYNTTVSSLPKHQLKTKVEYMDQVWKQEDFSTIARTSEYED